MSAGAVAAISALFSARRSEAAMRGTLSLVIRWTELSILVNAYHATELPMMVKKAITPSARNSLALMPRVCLPAPLGRPPTECELWSWTNAAPGGSRSTTFIRVHSINGQMPTCIPTGPAIASSMLQMLDRLEAAVRLDDCKEDLVHTLIVIRPIGQGEAAKIERAYLLDC